MFVALCSGAGAYAHIFDDFTFALFDRGGFCSQTDGNKIEGAFSDNFANSAGMSLFIDSCYDDEDTWLRGEADFSIFCSYDYARIGGESHNRMRYGIDAGLLFLNASFSQIYDFNDNKIDFVGGVGFRIGAWLSEHVGLDFSAGIERGFVSDENFIRINAGVIVVPFGARLSKKSARSGNGSPEYSKNDRELLDEAKNADGTEKLEAFCSHMASSGYHEKSLKNEGIAEIARRKFGTEGDNLLIAKPSDLENPFAIDGGKLIYLAPFSVILYGDDGILCKVDGADCEIPFVVRYNDAIRKAKPISRAYLRPVGTKSLSYNGTTRVVPVFDCAHFF